MCGFQTRKGGLVCEARSQILDQSIETRNHWILLGFINSGLYSIKYVSGLLTLVLCSNRILHLMLYEKKQISTKSVSCESICYSDIQLQGCIPCSSVKATTKEPITEPDWNLLCIDLCKIGEGASFYVNAIYIHFLFDFDNKFS